jgi:hypothetical protein
MLAIMVYSYYESIAFFGVLLSYTAQPGGICNLLFAIVDLRLTIVIGKLRTAFVIDDFRFAIAYFSFLDRITG